MNGFWTATFNTPLGAGYGVAFFTDSEVFGGDSAFTYLGSYQQDGQKITAKLRIAPFNNSTISVFGGSQPFDLTITGNLNGNTLSGQGSASTYPGVAFQVLLNRVR